MMGPPWCRICRLAHLLEEAPAHADVDGVATCLVRSEGRFCAVHDHCTHASGGLHKLR